MKAVVTAFLTIANSTGLEIALSMGGKPGKLVIFLNQNRFSLRQDIEDSMSLPLLASKTSG